MRVDFNVPLDKSTFSVTDNTRIKSSSSYYKKDIGRWWQRSADESFRKAIKKLKDDGTVDTKIYFKTYVNEVSKLLGVEVKFASDCVGAETSVLASKLQPGEVLLLENLRFHKGEEKGRRRFCQTISLFG